MPPFSFFQARRQREAFALSLYRPVVAQSRQEEFYVRLGVPDTLDGRFDLIVLHAFLVMRRLRAIVGGQAGEAKALSQELFDLMFADMDQSLREMGVSDMSVGKKIKDMAQAFYGRVAAYEAALADGEGLEAALARNLYATVSGGAETAVAAMAAYLRCQDAHLAAQSDAQILAGQVAFAPVAAAEGLA